LHPEKYSVKKVSELVGTFANNDIEHTDPTGADHESFSFGLKKSLLNYMHGACYDHPLQKWFEHKVPRTTIAPDYIIKAIEEVEIVNSNPNTKIIFLGNQPKTETIIKSKKGNQWELLSLTFETKKETFNIKVDKAQGEWLANILQLLSISNPKILTLQEVKTNYENSGLEDFELFWDNKPVNTLYKAGMLQF